MPFSEHKMTRHQPTAGADLRLPITPVSDSRNVSPLASPLAANASGMRFARALRAGMELLLPSSQFVVIGVAKTSRRAAFSISFSSRRQYKNKSGWATQDQSRYCDRDKSYIVKAKI